MGVLETIKTGCWCNRPSTCRRRASNVFSFFRCGLTSSGGAMLTDGNPCSSASSATSSIGGVVTASNALQLSGFFARRHRRSGPRVPSGRSSDKPRCPDGAASKSSAGGSRFFRPSVLPMPRQCGTCRRPAASRRTQGSKRPSTRFSDNTRQARWGSVNPFIYPAIEPPGRPEPRVRLSTLLGIGSLRQSLH
jgi:hypothetical protein